MEINHLRCYVELQGEKTETEVTLYQEEDGSLFCTLPIPQVTITFKENVSIQGVPKLFPYVLKPADSSKFSLLDKLLKVDFDNLELDPIYEIKSTDECTLRFYLNKLPFLKTNDKQYVNISGKTFSFSKCEQGCISTLIEINNVQYSDLKEIEEIIDDICWLLSFAR